MTSYRSNQANPVVILFGEVLADIFPDKQVLGGAPFNVACHLQAFGLHPVLISRTGNDDLRQQLLQRMAEAGMDTRGMQLDATHPTGRVMVDMQESGHHFNILREQAYDYIHAGLTHMITLKVRPEMVYFGTLAQRTTTSSMALTALIRSSRAPRLLDINLREPWYTPPILERSLQRAHLLKVNLDELDRLIQLFRLPGKNHVEQAAALIKKFSLECMLVTCGKEGAWQLNNAGKIFSTDGVAAPSGIVDTVGAGDGFSAVYMLGKLRGWHPAITMSRANAFAAALCGIRGAIPESPEFYAPFLQEWKA